ncbi:MAG TPA: hypothetical protein VGF59_07320 [Bryobacteraceae bacterium]|jgi:hypothetical protein
MAQMTEEHLTTADLARQAQDGEMTGRPRQEEEREGPLFPQDVMQDFRSRWDRVQTGFVDEPRQAVQQADELVANAIKRLAESFAEARNNLERQWDRGDEVSTEDLRLALRRYRTFFQRLLSV